MRLRLFLLTALLLPGALSAQEPRRVPDHRFALDARVASGTLSYAHRVRGDWFAGAGVGVGGDLLGQMLLAGSHFADGRWLSYEPREGEGEELLFELVSARVFARYEPAGRWQLDAGVHGSAFFHFDDSDDDPGGGTFLGVFGNALWGGRHLKLGPQVMAGVFHEHLHGRELGVLLSPVVVRVVLP